MSIENPSREQREQIIETVLQTFEKRFYDPGLHGVDLRGIAQARRDELLATDDFVGAIVALLKETRAHPVDFFHESNRKVSFARLAKATLHPMNGGASPWIFQDVLVDGPAYQANVQPGATLLGINGGELCAAAEPKLSANAPAVVQFRNPGAEPATFTVEPPLPGAKKKRDTTRYLTFSRPEPTVGYIRISMFPGILGIDIAKATDHAIRSLNGAKSLIVDLRGNLGSAGAGNLRLMSYLTPGKIPVGYSLTRRRAEQGYRREELIRFERVPSHKLLAPFALWRFRKVDRSIVVVTEGLGRQPFHGRIVLLVNEHTISGAEIVAGFATDHKLATIVGSGTAGKLLAWAPLPVGCGYSMTIPTGNYLTWEGKSFEGVGVMPNVDLPFLPNGVSDGVDHQLSAAIKAAKGM